MASLNAKAVQYTGGVNQSGSYALKPDAYYDRLLLKMLRQLEFHYSKYAVEKSLPKNFGDTINWRRFNKLAVTKRPLVEGETPEGQTVSGSSVTAVIAQYGNVMYFTDIVDLQQLDKIRQEYTVELGFQAKESLDEIVRDVLVAEGSAAFAHAGGSEGLGTNSAVSALAAADIPRIDDFRKIVLGMKKSFISGNRKASGKYVALVDPSVMAQLFEDQKVQDFMDFGKTNAMFSDGMVVDMFGIRFEEVLNAPTSTETTGNVDAYSSIIIGEEAYAITKLEGAGLKVITKGLGSAGVEDPLDQRQSIGWKISGFGARVLQPLAVVNYWSVPSFEAPTVSGTAEGVTITFVKHDDDAGSFVAQRGPVVLPTSLEYTYADAVALAFGNISGYYLYPAQNSAHSAVLTATTELTANITLYISDTQSAQ
jgi:N4-gp56 family major capsid protein